MLDTVRNLFYGDNWFIWWGIVAVPFAFGVFIQVPKTLKSIKNHKKITNKVK